MSRLTYAVKAAKRLSMLSLLLFSSISCGDELNSTFSNANPVRCFFSVVSYQELFNVVGNFGQYATIKKLGGTVTMSCASSTTTYNLDASQKYFDFGLGGLIVGTNYDGEYRAYDLACPNCNKKDIRLSISSDGMATCPDSKCKIQYNLNYDGVIASVPENCRHSKPRALLRYRVVCDGMNLNIYN